MMKVLMKMPITTMGIMMDTMMGMMMETNAIEEIDTTRITTTIITTISTTHIGRGVRITEVVSETDGDGTQVFT